MKGKIILINPPYLEFSKGISGSEWIAPPLGLGYLASVLLQNGYDVEILDMAVNKLKDEDLKEFITSRNPEIVGITSSTPAIKKAIDIAKLVKAACHEILVVLGGPHPTFLPEEVIKEEVVDVVVQGEGEITFLELVELFINKSDKRFYVLGTMQKNNNMIIFNPQRPLIDNLDSILFPARQLFNLELYRHPLMRAKRTLTILASRGCPFTCTYCNRGVFGHTYRFRSTENIINEIEYLIDKYSIDNFNFVDDNLTLNRKHIEELCNKIVERGLKINWSAPNGVCADAIDLDLAKLMKRSGCYSLSFGIETGNQKTLDYIKKNVNLNSIKKAFEVCHKLSIETVAFIIIGFPNEDRRDIDNTLRFLNDIKADVVDFHILIPLPGTLIYEELKEKKFILEDDWSKYTFHNLPIFRTEFFSSEEIFKEYKRAHREFYLRPSYIFSRIRLIRSLQDIKNNINGLMTVMRNYKK